MKNILISLVILLSFCNISFAEYTLSAKESKTINTAAQIINNYIEKKGESKRAVLINKVNLLIKRHAASEKNTAILQALLDGISQENIQDEDKVIVSPESSHSLFDENAVRSYWVGLLNNVREGEDLPAYIYDDSLDITAKKWSALGVKRGEITHKVDSGDSYYDYNKKVKWMDENGITCRNINGTTFSESIAWQEFFCHQSECSEQVKTAIKKSFDYYMAEKGKSYAPHYEAIINPEFKTMGLGLSLVNKGSSKYRIYLTNHYCTTNIK